jgi:hypothetical protein
MEYCTIQEAWGTDLNPKRKKGKKKVHFEEDVKKYNRDIKRLPDHNGPEYREDIKPIELDENMIEGYEQTNYRDLPDDNVKEGNDWLESRFDKINARLQELFERMESSPSGNNPEGGSFADTFLFVSTGVLTIFLLDMFFRAGMRLR